MQYNKNFANANPKPTLLLSRQYTDLEKDTEITTDHSVSTATIGNTINKTIFHASNALLRTTIQNIAKKYYKDALPDHVLSRALRRYDTGFLYMQNEEIVGFAIWRRVKGVVIKGCSKAKQNETYMDLLLVCAKEDDARIGSIIMNDLNSYCLRRSIRHISNSISIDPNSCKLANIYDKLGIVISYDWKVF
jgi:hypothetical protein